MEAVRWLGVSDVVGVQGVLEVRWRTASEAPTSRIDPPWPSTGSLGTAAARWQACWRSWAARFSGTRPEYLAGNRRPRPQGAGTAEAVGGIGVLEIAGGHCYPPPPPVIKNKGRPSCDFVMSICPSLDNSVSFVRSRTQQYWPDGSPDQEQR